MATRGSDYTHHSTASPPGISDVATGLCCHLSVEMTTFLPEMKISEKYASGPLLERTLGADFFKVQSGEISVCVGFN